jgi:hypothetical protein
MNNATQKMLRHLMDDALHAIGVWPSHSKQKDIDKMIEKYSQGLSIAPTAGEYTFQPGDQVVWREPEASLNRPFPGDDSQEPTRELTAHPCEIVLFNEIGRRLPGVDDSPNDFNPHPCGAKAVILVDAVKATHPYWCCYDHLPHRYKEALLGLNVLPLRNISDDHLYDVIYNILQVNLTFLDHGCEGTTLKDEDHESYFSYHVKFLRDLIEGRRP